MNLLEITTELHDVVRKHENSIQEALEVTRHKVLSAKVEVSADETSEENLEALSRAENELYAVRRLYDLKETINETVFDIQSDVIEQHLGGEL